MNQLIQYIIALTNLYGLVHKDKILEIYNSQNENQVNISDVEEILSNPPKEMEGIFFYAHKDYFVHETILENNDFNSMLMTKADKPHYVPAKRELLKYVDEVYFEKSEQYNALLKYVKQNFLKNDEEKAEWLCEEVHGTCQFGADMQTILDAFNVRGISFEDIDQVNEVIQLVMGVCNNTRIWENNGHTPREIFERFEKPKLKPLPDKPFEFRSNAKREKIGRNALCPCGSGKKYKKCCLGKENI